MNEVERRMALHLARAAIREFLETGHEIEPPEEQCLAEPRGVFVSLKMNEELRGCIGYAEPHLDLGKAIVKCAIHSATEDPRFRPLTLSEFSSVRIEISILSPFHTVDDPEHVQVGTHGILISSGTRRGLLLPQVPAEYDWDREEFLKYGCRKAGLPDEAWKHPETSIQVFSAEVFGEEFKD